MSAAGCNGSIHPSEDSPASSTFEFRSHQQAPAPDRTRRCRVRVPTKYFVLVTSIVSTCVSCVGGWILYQRTLESLRKIHVEVSESDVSGLRATVERTVDGGRRSAHVINMTVVGPWPTSRPGDSYQDELVRAEPTLRRAVFSTLSNPESHVYAELILASSRLNQVVGNASALWIRCEAHTVSNGTRATLVASYKPTDKRCPISADASTTGPCLHTYESAVATEPTGLVTIGVAQIDTLSALQLTVSVSGGVGSPAFSSGSSAVASVKSYLFLSMRFSLTTVPLPGMQALYSVRINIWHWQRTVREYTRGGSNYLSITTIPQPPNEDEACRDDDLGMVTTALPECSTIPVLVPGCNMTLADELGFLDIAVSQGIDIDTLQQARVTCAKSCCGGDPNCELCKMQKEQDERSREIVVFATSDREQQFRDDCGGESVGHGDLAERCRWRLDDLPDHAAQAISEVRFKQADGFYSTSLGAGEYYVRALRLPSFGMLLLWMRPARDEAVFQALIMLVCVVVGVFAVDLCVAMLELKLYAQPLARMEREMMQVAEMQVSSVDHRGYSCLVEVRDAERGFGHLVTQLGQYRAYLPLAVLPEAGKRSPSHSAAPGGNIGVCFTDIVGSSRLWEADPAAMNVCLELHNQLMRAQLALSSGYEVKTIGDAFMATFDSAANTILFGAGIMEALVKAEWPKSPVLEVVNEKYARTVVDGRLLWNGVVIRAGAAYGEADAEVNPVTGRVDYRGATVRTAATLEATAMHGVLQVTPECVAAAVGDHRLDSIRFTEQADNPCVVALPDSLLARLAKPPDSPSSAAQHRNSADSRQLLSFRHPVSPSACSGADFAATGGEVTTSFIGPVSPTSPLSTPSFRLSLSSPKATPRRPSTVRGCVATVEQYSLDPEGVAGRGGIVSLVQRIVVAAGRSQGAVGTVHGCRVQLTWNLATPCSVYQWKPIEFASAIRSRRRRDTVLGIASGPIVHGYVGSSTFKSQRFHAVIGPAPYFADELASAALGMDCEVLACWLPQTPPALSVFCRPVDVWGYGDGLSAVIEQPLSASVPTLLQDSDTEDGGGDDPVAPDRGSYRVDFESVIRTRSVDAMARIEMLAAHTEGEDPVLMIVAERLRAHMTGTRGQWRVRARFAEPAALGAVPASVREYASVLSPSSSHLPDFGGSAPIPPALASVRSPTH
eukprot:TRINITY_DN24566_c0_g1_i1.p1 TRINITY_DN24566_c0_g1~~TRINITY_DN24566_c0_g1_i1.p1  ORF type:complete len:1193 (+),score=131.96 TRINITY_DN24566_c0_g1_i1:37-3579(+)